MLKFLYRFVTPWAKADKMHILINRILGGLANLFYPIWCKIVPNKVRVGKNEGIIVSFTSFPGRIDKVHLCAQSLLRQSYSPEKIILWLAKEQFPNGDIPRELNDLQKDGLEIKFCEDYRSYKKFFETAREFPDKRIVIVDDDTLYPEDWLERLVKKADDYPECVVCYRAHDIMFDHSNHVLPYLQWDGLSKDKTGPSYSLIPIGVGGVLYPSGFFKDYNFDFDKIRQCCLKTDDIWLKIRALKLGIQTVKVDSNSKEWFTVKHSQGTNLMAENVGENNNDIALKKLMEAESLDLYKLCYK